MKNRIACVVEKDLQALQADRGKSPKRHLRALCKSYRKHPEAPNNTSFLLHLPAVCKAGGLPDVAIGSHSLSMVRFSILHLQKLLERTGILL
jgi:hypothetical protein